MTTKPPHRTLRALACSEGTELTLKLSRSAVLLVPHDCTLLVLAGRTVEMAHGLSRASSTSDLRVERALRAMRAEPARPWTTAALAKLVRSSRTTFVRAFAAAVGETPRAWLRRLRLDLARTAVETSDAKLAEIAARVGYVSEFALSRAFKARFGVAPGNLRHAVSTARTPLRCAA
jgi:transcriptional regulator GlxA family with amidase domain